MQKIMPLTDLQRTAGQVVNEISTSHDSIVITHRGRPAAILMSVARYEEMEADLHRLDELELLDMVEKARAARKEGKTLTQKQVKDRLKKKFAVNQKAKR